MWVPRIGSGSFIFNPGRNLMNNSVASPLLKKHRKREKEFLKISPDFLKNSRSQYVQPLITQKKLHSLPRNRKRSSKLNNHHRFIIFLWNQTRNNNETPQSTIEIGRVYMAFGNEKINLWPVFWFDE